MPKQRKKEEIQCQFFRWLVGQHKVSGMYYADGRSNTPSLGRHSLGSKDRRTARAHLNELDLTMAVRNGLANETLLNASADKQLSLIEGRRIYEKYVKRPAVAKGPKPSTAKRYRAVFDKFLSFCGDRNIRLWNQVTRAVFDDYAAWLDAEGYAYATEYLEINTLKQILKYLVQQDHLPASSLFAYPMRKPTGTDTYCWTDEQVTAMIDHCNCPDLQWLKAIILTLARTGMRISELASLRWTDVNLECRMIRLTDERTLQTKKDQDRRTLKSGYDRSFPIHDELLESLSTLEHHQDGRGFHGPLGGIVKPDTIRRSLIRDVLTPLAERFPNDVGEVGFVHGRLHSFRHYFCSACANAGIPEPVLMQWLGHRSSRMVRHYYHLHDDEAHRQMNRLKSLGSTGDGTVSAQEDPASM